MKRLSLLILVLAALVLGACAPNVTVESNVLPTLISVTVPPSGSGNI